MMRILATTMCMLTITALSPTAVAGPEIPVHDAVDDAQDGLRGNVLWDAVNQTYALGALCGGGPHPNTQCNQTTGHYGMGQLRACKARPSAPNTLAWPLYNTVANLDRTTDALREGLPLPAPLSSARVCSGAYDVANETAAAYGPTFV